MTLSPHMEKTFTEASCISNIHNGEKFLGAATFEGL